MPVYKFTAAELLPIYKRIAASKESDHPNNVVKGARLVLKYAQGHEKAWVKTHGVKQAKLINLLAQHKGERAYLALRSKYYPYGSENYQLLLPELMVLDALLGSIASEA